MHRTRSGTDGQTHRRTVQLLYAVIFLPARPGSQTHASHKGRMILNHESPAGCIKIVAKSLHLVFATFVLSVFVFF